MPGPQKRRVQCTSEKRTGWCRWTRNSHSQGNDDDDDDDNDVGYDDDGNDDDDVDKRAR